TARFQHFERGGQVENALGPGADDGHRRAGQLDEVGGNVPGEWGPLAGASGLSRGGDAADAAGGEGAQAGAVGEGQGGGDGGGGAGPLADRRAQVAAAGLAHAGKRRQALQVGARQADGRPAVPDGDGGGHGAGGADGGLGGAGGLEVERPGQAVGD